MNHVGCFDAHLQLIKDKEECLSQLVAEANALVLKQRSLSSDLIRVRRERQEHIDSYRSVCYQHFKYGWRINAMRQRLFYHIVDVNFVRRLTAENLRCWEVFNNLKSQFSSLPDSPSDGSFLKLPSPACAPSCMAASDSCTEATVSSATTQDGDMATLEFKLKLFESQTAMVSQARINT